VNGGSRGFLVVAPNDLAAALSPALVDVAIEG